MSTPLSVIDEILVVLARTPTIDTKESFHKLKNEILAKYRISRGPPHIALIERYRELVEA